MGIKIGELAKLTRCEVVTIRYYEKQGLLPQPIRNDGNFRIYDDADVERLEFIRHSRSLDLTLAEIRSLLSLRDKPQQDCSNVNSILDCHIQQVEIRVKALMKLKALLAELRQTCAGAKHTHSCGVLQGLASRASFKYDPS